MMNDFYTYAYLREDRTPYYIGKGKDDRCFIKGKKESVSPPKDKLRIIFLKQNLTEQEAFKHEIYMIAMFGRKDNGTGILRNMTDGGEGASNQGTPEQRSESARKANENMTPEQRSERARKGGLSLTPEQQKESMRKARSVKFQCTVTGFITNAGCLSHYQRARGIDTSNRVRVS